MKKFRILSIVVMVGFFSVIGTAVAFSLFDENTDTNTLDDVIDSSDSANITLNSSTNDELTVKDSAAVTVSNDNYFIDEDGKKHYTIDAVDSPTIQK